MLATGSRGPTHRTSTSKGGHTGTKPQIPAPGPRPSPSLVLEALQEERAGPSISLSQGEYEEGGAARVAEALKTNATVTAVDWSWSFLDDDALQVIGDMLEVNRTLLSLNFSWNVISDDGVCRVSESLGKNTTVESVDFSRNNIGDKGATALATILQAGSGLTSLNLSFTRLGDEGARALAVSAKQNKSIKEIIVQHTGVGENGRLLLESALGQRDGTVALSGEIPELSVTYADEANGILGCRHYQRGCKLRAHCCGKFFTCRFCHDEVSDHVMDRTATQEMMCMTCMTRQPIGPMCTTKTCGGRSMAHYYCNKCKFFDGDNRKSIYHCPYCETCRVGKGLGVDTIHCMKCNSCVSFSQPSHRCVEDSPTSVCSICEQLTTKTPIIRLACGHCVHDWCYEALADTDYACPLCHSKTAPQSLWGALTSLYSFFAPGKKETTPPPVDGSLKVFVDSDAFRKGQKTGLQFLKHNDTFPLSEAIRNLDEVAGNVNFSKRTELWQDCVHQLKQTQERRFIDPDGNTYNFRDAFLQSNALDGMIETFIYRPDEILEPLLGELFKHCLYGESDFQKQQVTRLIALAKTFQTLEDISPAVAKAVAATIAIFKMQGRGNDMKGKIRTVDIEIARKMSVLRDLERRVHDSGEAGADYILQVERSTASAEILRLLQRKQQLLASASSTPQDMDANFRSLSEEIRKNFGTVDLDRTASIEHITELKRQKQEAITKQLEEVQAIKNRANISDDAGNTLETLRERKTELESELALVTKKIGQLEEKMAEVEEETAQSSHKFEEHIKALDEQEQIHERHLDRLQVEKQNYQQVQEFIREAHVSFLTYTAAIEESDELVEDCTIEFLKHVHKHLLNQRDLLEYQKARLQTASELRKKAAGGLTLTAAEIELPRQFKADVLTTDEILKEIRVIRQSLKGRTDFQGKPIYQEYVKRIEKGFLEIDKIGRAVVQLYPAEDKPEFAGGYGYV